MPRDGEADLIPVQGLPCHRQEEGQSGQDYTDQPESLLAAPVAPSDKDPQHVDQDQRKDKKSIPVMEIEDDMPARRIDQVFGDVVGLTCIWHVDEREQHAREDLKDERNRQNPTQEIPDAVRFHRDQVLSDEGSDSELLLHAALQSNRGWRRALDKIGSHVCCDFMHVLATVLTHIVAVA